MTTPVVTEYAAIGPQTFAMDYAAETARISEFLVQSVRQLNRRGLVLGISGGIDSAACVALAVAALGPRRVFGLLMPERDMVDDSHDRAERLCQQLGIEYAVEDIGPSLEAIGCYSRRDAAIASIVPGYDLDWKHKIVISPATESMIAHFNIVVQNPAGEQSTIRMPLDVYLTVVAATNFKQRIRKNLEYYYGDKLNYAVLGTPNKLEYDLGFFVRGGDGLADIKPIAHLYKTQVYGIAAHLGVSEEILRQLPSTNTYSLPQTQEEFYFSLPYEKSDIALYGMENGISATDIAVALGLTPSQAEAVYRNLSGKRRAADRLMGDALRIA
ncbi:MAG: NAD(+) synthase [Alphaproteobacteria bacterium]